MSGKAPLRNIKLTVAYDGTDFSGWQRQASDRSVQAVIEDALQKIHKSPAVIHAAGRTDSGVHAAGQAVNFYSPIAGMNARSYVPALNSILPPDVRILSAEDAPLKFHARFDALLRRYRYHFICNRQALPHERRYAMQLSRHPDINLLNEYARLLHGEMDCSFFASPSDSALKRGGSPFRFIHQAYFFQQADKLVFEIGANAFLWKMVRSITGTLLFCESRSLPPAVLKELMFSGDHRKAGPTAPPQGLFLWNVEYPLNPPVNSGCAP
ncbi:MAG: tRNA pseudouridine(38-40) synthase TruA [Spirochaetaceae bacterium]|jgi:tRNA pseudouridine38-40 synthase|nr:tRNA pseudouridine(38-40) synthase TruA [Spirochaetaceae bacterium]